MIDFEDKFPENTMYRGTPEEKGKARDLERVIDPRLGGPMGLLAMPPTHHCGSSAGA